MAAFSQILLLPLLLAAVTGWPHPYPWLQTIMQNPQQQYYETYPYSSMDLQNNPFLSGLFQNPGTFSPDANYIVGQLPFNIQGHPAYVNDPYFIGYRPEDIDWDKVPKIPCDGDFGNHGNDKPDDNTYDGQHGNVGGETGDSNDQDPNTPYGYDKVPHVNDNRTPGAAGSRPQEADEDLPIDPRKDEAKYNKPH